jgi:hypothetical protein
VAICIRGVAECMQTHLKGTNEHLFINFFYLIYFTHTTTPLPKLTILCRVKYVSYKSRTRIFLLVRLIKLTSKNTDRIFSQIGLRNGDAWHLQSVNLILATFRAQSFFICCFSLQCIRHQIWEFLRVLSKSKSSQI